MDLVFLTFGLLFAIFRIFCTVASEQSGGTTIRRYGTRADYLAEHCDLELQEKYEKMVHCNEEKFDELWDMLERLKIENADKIAAGPERTRKVWDVLVDGKRKPFRPYDIGFEHDRGFYSYCSGRRNKDECTWNSLRAVYLLLSLHDKVPLTIARGDYDKLTGKREDIGYDPIVDWYPQRFEDWCREQYKKTGMKY